MIENSNLWVCPTCYIEFRTLAARENHTCEPKKQMCGVRFFRLEAPNTEVICCREKGHMNADGRAHHDDKPEVFDAVTKPKHYNTHPSGVECITITQHHNFSVGNAIKYLWRQGLKEGESSEKDLRKAIQYIEFELRRIKK